MYDKETFLFFYFLILIRNNLKIMNVLRKSLLQRPKNTFSYIDAILIYYYIVVGLQADTAFTFVEKYWKKYHNSPVIPYLTSQTLQV